MRVVEWMISAIFWVVDLRLALGRLSWLMVVLRHLFAHKGPEGEQQVSRRGGAASMYTYIAWHFALVTPCSIAP
jgi:hypothetical protein